jgi:carbamoyltransferase
MQRYFIGLSVTFHDPALAILNDQGEVLFAEATERYLQHKRALNCSADPIFYIEALLKTYCPFPTHIVLAFNWEKHRPWYETWLSHLGILSAPGLLHTGIKPLRAPLPNYQLHHMMASQHTRIQDAGLNWVRMLREWYPDCKISFKNFDHHLTHAAMACYSSPFEEAACAVVDSYGERGAMAFYRYQGRKLHRLYEANGWGLSSLGLFYMKLTELCGFDWLKGEEWKVMGLAAYGKLNPDFYRVLDQLIEIEGFKCKHPAKNFFETLADMSRFKRSQETSALEMADVAYTGQAFFAEKLSQLLNHLYTVTQSENLTLAGGCALNSAFNGQITVRTPFKHVHIPSAPADDGCALGAAWLAWNDLHAHPNRPARLLGPYLGAKIDESGLKRFMTYQRSLTVEHFPENICEVTATLLTEGNIVAWVQGRAEYGPRALGNRSILADPRSVQIQDRINQSIKFRELFRPFAPSVLHEHAERFFENYQESPYMDKTLKIRENVRHIIPAVTHVDGTGRLQTVKQIWNPRFYELLSNFFDLTQVPVLLNTSFNVMGKPLVHSLEDALAVFLTSGLDILVINDYVIRKSRAH